MRAHEIEDWTLRVIGQVKSGQPNEDYRVELKSEWPDTQKAARRIAGHANAAHGEPILWIIGVDENSGVVGANREELANWHAQVRSQFDGVAPDLLRNLNVPAGKKTVVALLFDTDRAPYLVKNPRYNQEGGGQVQFEVPWREGNSTRTASRSDLLTLLSPLQKNPTFEPLGAWLKVYPELGPLSATGGRTYSDDPSCYTCKLSIQFYVSPRTDARVVIPFHRCMATLEIPERVSETQFRSIIIAPLASLTHRSGAVATRTDSLTIENTKYEVLIDGPGRIVFCGEAEIPKTELNCKTAEVRVSISPVDAEHPIVFRETLRAVPPDVQKHELACWSFESGERIP
jgi:hypothetical protein